ncbi:hypothetical protein [Pseudoalteromonas sp. MMG012]|uniref:hypothetical protein n=1 Tax=Pseudoalteromonas sp. MMG012 TaxID=2822686 RepID=UPI001B3A1FD8|nr:hypothetical protein [Pseudoalteromonas sp. MMG012]MBQ4848811.1 hypothetical protein [Pseudoalteromonas sp. MMG012]
MINAVQSQHTINQQLINVGNWETEMPINIAKKAAEADHIRQNKFKEITAKENRENLPYHMLLGVVIVICICTINEYLMSLSWGKLGGTMVGLSLIGQSIVHWIELNPTRDNLKSKESMITVVSGVVALIGTILWTFG